VTVVERDAILKAITETAASNGGKPLGRGKFEEVTGITAYDLGRYWARYGDAVRDAGFEANTLNAAYSRDYLEKYLELVVKLGHVPTYGEMRLERTSSDPEFPSKNVYARFGSKKELVRTASDFCVESGSHPDAMRILEAGIPPAEAPDDASAPAQYGFVYLAKGHRGEYKVGRTNLVDRRLAELGVQAAVEPQLVHEIKTDDPEGVERYWLRRFTEDGKHLRGEWFKLNAADVRAFKRWKRLY
jgi:hypothetical protein